jgi:NADH-quinone oxidoreductase subunit N
MALPMPSMMDLHVVMPEVFVCGAAFALLMADLFISDSRRGLTHFLALMILIAAFIVTGRSLTHEAQFAFSETFVRDSLADILKMAVYGVVAFAFIYAKPWLRDRDLFKGEFYALCLFAMLGMMLMISANSMLVLYLGLEMLALSSYGLVAMDRDNATGSEAAMKYFVLGALASGLLLYGMSLIYGASASLQLDVIAQTADSGQDSVMFLLGVVFVLVGIAFKFGAAPFHMWVPDVYQGAPTPVTLFIGSAPKIAAFAMAFRMLETGAGPISPNWQLMIGVIAALSLVIGNLFALVQTNLRRMLAFSTVSHVGFLLMGFANADATGYSAAMFYAISYAIMSACAFAAIIVFSRKGFDADNISDYRGLAKRHPWYALMILFIMASLAGVPPFLGFWAKVEVIRAALKADMMWLAILGVVFAVIGAFYYLRVIKVMYFDESENDTIHAHEDSHLRVVFSINAIALLGLGIFAEPLSSWCRYAFGLSG